MPALPHAPPPPRPPPSPARWAALTAAGLASSPADDVLVATNAAYYKAFEHWAFGKGVPVAHVVNSGRSVGDARCVRNPPRR